MLWCFRAAIRHKARSIRSRACLARDTTMRLPRMFRRDVPEVSPPEGCINSGSSKYALACFGVLELVYAKSVRGADCAKMENLHRRSTCKVAVSFGTFLVRQEKYRKTFIQQKQQKGKNKLYTLHKITLLRQKILDKAPMLAYNG